ncbi:hypothetical protein DICSQDRAFT_63954, partial [Dichomitus squalens LYAD-421 SS1]
GHITQKCPLQGNNPKQSTSKPTFQKIRSLNTQEEKPSPPSERSIDHIRGVFQGLSIQEKQEVVTLVEREGF